MTACPRIDVARTQAAGSVAIAGETMHRVAFAIASVAPLWAPAPRRGGNLVVPGRAGTLALPRHVTEAKVALPMVIDGRFLPDDSPAPDDLAGLAVTLRWLDDNIVGTTPRTLTLTPAAGPDLTATVNVEGVTLGDRNRGLWFAVLDLTIPAGRLNVAP